MKPVTPVFLLLLCSFFAASQNPLVKQWDYRYGGTNSEILYALERTSDGGFILGGSSFSDSSADKSQPSRGGADFWIVKTDSLGIKQWDKCFGGSDGDAIYSLQQTRDDGFILGGVSLSDSGWDKTQRTRGAGDYWMVKTDRYGNKLWDKRFGGTGNEVFSSLCQTNDGGYLLGGYSVSNIGGDNTQDNWDTFNGSADYWIVKTDSAGNKQWDKRFGGISRDCLNALQQTTDGGYILGGYSESDSSGDKTQQSRGWVDYWIVKTDAAGNQQWDKRFGGTNDDVLYSLQQTTDRGYILAGISRSGPGGDKTAPFLDTGLDKGDFWLVKVDSAGTKQWDKKLGGTNEEDEFGKVRQTSDGGYLVSGTSYSGPSGDKTESNSSNEQSWIIKTDALGNRQWDKTMHTVHVQFVMDNYTNSLAGGDKTDAAWNASWDFWIIKYCDSSFHCNLAPAVVSAGQTTFCANDSTEICAPDGMLSYQWNTGAVTKCITASQAGNYYVTVADNNGCTATSNHLAISVYPSPPVTISVSGDTLHAYHATTYQWFLNGNEISGAVDSIYIVQQTGLYAVAVTDSNGCYATSNPVAFSGLDDTTVTWPAINIYPSPTTNKLFIQSKNETVVGLNIYNTSGELIAKVDQPVSAGINVADFAAGVYVVEIKTRSGSFMRRWVKL